MLDENVAIVKYGLIHEFRPKHLVSHPEIMFVVRIILELKDILLTQFNENLKSNGISILLFHMFL